jgi:hypothetical protein
MGAGGGAGLRIPPRGADDGAIRDVGDGDIGLDDCPFKGRGQGEERAPVEAFRHTLEGIEAGEGHRVHRPDLAAHPVRGSGIER